MSRRILLLVTDLEIGGTPTVVRELALRLRRPGEVHVEVACLGRAGPVARQLDDAGTAVMPLGASRVIELPRVVRQVIRLIRDGQIDTVFSFLIHANTVAAIASRFCRDVRFIQSIQTTQPKPRWHWWLQGVVQRAADAVVVPSPSAAKVASEWADVPQATLVVIPNAIDPGEFCGARASRTDDTVNVGFLGRLDPVKRIPDLLHAIASLDDRYELHIFGEGSERAHLEDLIDRLGITERVTLHGATASPQIALEQVDLLVLPSQAEGFGLVLIEAMAAGVPVVATQVPGIRDVVRNEQTGLLVPVASPSALAAAIRRVSEDQDLRSRLMTNALADVRARFTWDVVLPQYEALLRL